MSSKTRILFVGELVSSHAQSWIDLLKSSNDFEIVGFNIPTVVFPENTSFPLYGGYLRHLSKYNRLKKLNESLGRSSFKSLMRSFKPHIVHSFGAFPSSVFIKDMMPNYQDKTKWVMQVRGGPDVYLNRLDPGNKTILEELFKKCDVLIADNDLNYQIAIELGLEPKKKFEFGIVPGAGGMDLDDFKDALKPSASERQVLWTKAYEWNEAKGLPVLEALRIAYPQLPGVKFIFTALNAEVATWINFLPEDLKSRIETYERLPRKKIFELMKSSRIVMAPSILEGIPNALYESMAAQSVPIFSPLPTFKDKFQDRQNILYARNLYPQEIADALIEAFNDDKKVDQIAATNLELVEQIANRKRISQAVRSLYRNLTK